MVTLNLETISDDACENKILVIRKASPVGKPILIEKFKDFRGNWSHTDAEEINMIKNKKPSGANAYAVIDSGYCSEWDADGTSQSWMEIQYYKIK